MCDVNSREKIFLSKLEVILSKFDEMDELFLDLGKFVNEQPDNQQRIDYLLSDLSHRLENDDLSEDEMVNIAKQIHDARLTRRDECATSSLIKTYNDNKQKLSYSVKGNRAMFRSCIERTRSHLHEDYKYRVLTDEDLEKLKEKVIVRETTNDDKPVTRRKRKSGLPDEEILRKCFQDNMRNKDIAEQFHIDPAVVSRLRGLYGFPTRKYNKKG